MRQWFLHPRSVGSAVVVAIGVRLAVGWYFQSRLPDGQAFEFGDSDGYWVLGQSLSSGGPYQYHSADAQVFRMPGYPAILAPLFMVFGPNVSPYAGRVMSALFGGLTVLIVAAWVALLFDAPAATIAGWLTALYPGSVAMGSFVLSEAPFMPFMAAHLALATAAYQRQSFPNRQWLTVGAGLCAAAAIYIRPSWLLFIPFALVASLLFDSNRKRQLMYSGLSLAIVGICLTPWWIRNARVTGQFVPTTLQVGASLYDGWNPNATGGSNMDFSSEAVSDHARQQGIANPAQRDEFMLNKCYQGMAIAWAKAHPQRVIELAAIKFSRMWNFIPNEPMFRSLTMKLAVAFTYGPLLAIGLFGLFKFRRCGWIYLLPALPAVYFTLLHVIFVSGIRYREPAMLGIIVLASGVTGLWFQEKQPRKLQTAS